mgnify:CR=1 FL=1
MAPIKTARQSQYAGDQTADSGRQGSVGEERQRKTHGAKGQCDGSHDNFRFDDHIRSFTMSFILHDGVRYDAMPL